MVWLVGAHPLVRAGLRARLDKRGFETVAEARSLDEILRAGEGGPTPDLLILSHELGSDAVATCKARQPQARIVVMAEKADISDLADMFGAGADGYVLTSITPDALIESLKLVVLGEKVFPGALSDVLKAMPRGPLMRVGGIALTQRELELIRSLTEGHSNKEIARKLTATEGTIKAQLKAILAKLGAHNRTQVAIWAVQHGVTKTDARCKATARVST